MFVFSQSSLILHDHESVHTKTRRFQEYEFVLQPFLHLYLVNSTIASGTDEFNINSLQKFKPSTCNPFPTDDGRFNAGTHADLQIHIWQFTLREKVGDNLSSDTFFFINISCRNSLISEVALFSWYREQTNWITATTEEHSKDSDWNSPKSRISVDSSVFFSSVWNTFFCQFETNSWESHNLILHLGQEQT